MKRIRALVFVPVLAAAVAGVGQTHKAAAASCSFSLFPGQTAVYYSSLYGTYNISGGSGVAAFYLDPFGTLTMASPSGPSAVYTNSSGGWSEFGDSGVAIVCTPPGS